MKKLHLLLVFLLANSITYAQDYWKKVSTPSHKDLLGISFGSPGTGYIGGTDSTLLKTTDGGKTWTNLHHTGIGYETLTPDIIDLKFVSANTGYAILSNRERPDINGQLYKTSDGGHSWTKVPEIWTSAYRGFFFDEHNGYLIGGTPFGGPTLHKLDPGGWSAVHYLGVGTSYRVTAIDFLNTATGVVGGDYGYVYRTFDAGLSWDTVKTNVDSAIHALRYLDENTIVAASGNIMTLLISHDKGASWTFEPHSASFYYPDMKAMALSARDSLVSVGKSRTTGKGIIYYFDPLSAWMVIADAEQWLNNVALRNDSVAYIVGDSGLILSNDHIVLSLPEEKALQQLLCVYPNPSDGLFSTELPVPHRILVRDLLGKVVYRDERLSPRHHADLGTLPKGSYLLEAIPAGGGGAFFKLQLQ
jgi:photosystem II stability/assembly factor-like uncharacterized protein